MNTSPASLPLEDCSLTYDTDVGAWVVKDLELARMILRRHEIFSTDAYSFLNPDISNIRRFVMASDGDHRRLRRVTAKAFAPDRVELMVSRILRPLADELVGSLPVDGAVDLQERYVAPYTRAGLYGIIGLSPAAGDELVAAYRVADKYFREVPGSPLGRAAVDVLYEIAALACNDVPAYPDASLLGMASAERWLDGILDTADLVCLFMSFIEAAATKAHRDLTATTLRRIAALSADQRAALADGDEYERASEEALRLQPEGVLLRTATRDLEVAGSSICAGDRILLIVDAIATDDSVFRDALTYDPWRPELGRAIGFGVGVHRCVGEQIAKRIAMTACEALLVNADMSLVEESERRFVVTLRPRP